MNQFRWDLVQLQMMDVVKAVMPAGLVAWSNQAPNRGELDMATLSVVAGPVDHNRSSKSKRCVQLPGSATLTITAATADERVFTKINGVEYWSEVVGGDTIEDVRDRHLAVLQDEGGTGPDVVAAASSTDAITLTPAEAGGLWDVKIAGPVSGVAAGLGVYDFSSTTKRVTINVQVFARSTAPRAGADYHMNNIVSALEQPSVLRSFQARGIGVWGKSAPVPSRVLVGTTAWEGRSSLDVDITLRSVKAEAVEAIENLSTTLEGKLVVDGPLVHTGTFTIS